MPKSAIPPRRRRFKQAGVRFISVFVPYLYLAYMRLVRLTSRVQTPGLDKLKACNTAGKGALVALLHQDLLIAPYLFRGLDLATLVNVGDAGNILTRTLDKLGFMVIRGGSSTRKSRRTAVIKEIVEVTARPEHAGMVTVITPDGSRGPAGSCKPGVAWLSMKTGIPILCAHVHARRTWYLPTWDRTSFPLPFNVLSVEVEGPIEPPASATREDMERCRAEIEATLHRLHAQSFARDNRRPVPTLSKLPVRTAGEPPAAKPRLDASASA